MRISLKSIHLSTSYLIKKLNNWCTLFDGCSIFFKLKKGFESSCEETHEAAEDSTCAVGQGEGVVIHYVVKFVREKELVQQLHFWKAKTRLEKELWLEHLDEKEERERYESNGIKTVFCNTILCSCVHACTCIHTACMPFFLMYAHMHLFSVCVSIKCKSLKPRDKCMKCYCGGAGPAPEEVLGFDNALTRNALQAAAKWACRCPRVGSQVWSVQFWTLRRLGGPFCSAVVQKEGEPEGKEGREGVGLCVLVSLVCIDFNECVCVCVFPLRGGSERNATVPLHMSTPLRQLQGLLKTDTHPWHAHTHAEFVEWKEVSNYTGRILIKTEEKSCPLRFQTFTA